VLFRSVGKSSLQKNGFLNTVKSNLQGLHVRVVSGISPLPTLTAIEELVKHERDHARPDAIVGIGGGSVLDSAKCLATLLVQQKPLSEILDDRTLMEPDSIPCFAVPTTAGTGSEVTSSATIWDMHRSRKYSLHNESMYPEYALLDPNLTLTLPPYVTAITGLDAMAHAIEAAYSINSTAESDENAFAGLRMILAELESAVRNGSNRASREKLLRASLQAGLAIAVTSTAAAHSVSYPLTIHYGVPHGHAVGLLVPEFLAFNGNVSQVDCQDPRGVSFVVDRCKSIASVFGCNNPVEARNRIRQFIAKVGLETSLRELGVKDLGVVSREGLDPDRASNQPRVVTEQAVHSLLESIYD
jgi:alcohol dehydrogenase class IV